MTRFLLPVLAGASLVLSGCVAKAALDVVSVPVKVAGKTVDLATTSQAEADRNYGKKARKAQAREERERRAREKACRKDPTLCDSRDADPRDRR